MFQPRYSLQQPLGLPTQLWLRDETGDQSAQNPGGWPAAALATATLSVTIHRMADDTLTGGPYLLTAAAVAEGEYVLPFGGADGVYELVVEVSDSGLPLPVLGEPLHYGLRDLPLAADHHLSVLRGDDIGTGEFLDVTAEIVRTASAGSGGGGGLATWTSPPSWQPYLLWRVTAPDGSLLEAGDFTQPPAFVSAVASTPSPQPIDGRYGFVHLIDRQLAHRLDGVSEWLASRLSQDPVASPREAEALGLWQLLQHRHHQLRARLGHDRPADLDATLDQLRRMADRLTRLTPC